MTPKSTPSFDQEDWYGMCRHHSACIAQGDRDGAVKVWTDGLKRGEELFGDEWPDATICMVGLLGAYLHFEDWANAETWGKKAVEVTQQQFGQATDHTLAFTSTVATGYAHQRPSRPAQELFEQVIQRGATGGQKDDNPVLVEARLELASIHAAQGSLAKAEALATDVVETRERALGPKHADALVARMKLVAIYLEQGKLSLAAKQGSEVAGTLRDVLGYANLTTRSCMANLALTYAKLGRYSEAEAIQRQLIEEAKKYIETNHVELLTYEMALGSTYAMAGRTEKAKPLQEAALTKMRSLRGDKEYDTLIAISELAWTYRLRGDYDDARVLGEELAESVREKVGTPYEYEDTSQAFQNLALTYRCLKRFKDAERLQEQALEVQHKRLGPQHPLTLAAMANLTATIYDLGEMEKASGLMERIMARLDCLSRANPSVFTSLNNLAWAASQSGHHKWAEELWEKAVESRKTFSGSTDPESLISMCNLAMEYAKLDKLTDAEKLMKDTIRLASTALEKDDAITLKCLYNLGLIYLKQERQELQRQDGKVQDDWRSRRTGEAPCQQKVLTILRPSTALASLRGIWSRSQRAKGRPSRLKDH